jgi:hypothetical protein
MGLLVVVPLLVQFPNLIIIIKEKVVEEGEDLLV